MAAVLALTIAEGAAMGSADQSGRYSASHSYDGVKAQVEGDSFNVDSGHCLVYTILVYQPDDNRQIEGGLARCDNATIDGSCNSGDKFIETWKGPGLVPGVNFLCYPHGSFTNGTEYTVKFQRHDSAASDQFDSYIGGNQYQSLSGFDYHHTNTLWAWGEHTGGTNCSGWGPSTGWFFNWQHFYYGGSGWSYITGTANPSCMNVSSIDGVGDFHVSRS